jgi:hypothetical protein
MRAVLRSIVALASLPVAFVLGAQGCRGDEPTPPGVIDCAYLAGSGNCVRPFVAAVDRCLGHPDGGFDAAIGLLSEDGTRCAYDDGRAIVATVPLDLRADGGDPRRRDFEVRAADASCLRFEQQEDRITAQGPTGTLAWSREGDSLTVTCPDAAPRSAAIGDLVGCLGPSGGLPGYSWSATDRGAYFALLGMRGPAYACRSADAALE